MSNQKLHEIKLEAAFEKGKTDKEAGRSSNPPAGMIAPLSVLNSDQSKEINTAYRAGYDSTDKK